MSDPDAPLTDEERKLYERYSDEMPSTREMIEKWIAGRSIVGITPEILDDEEEEPFDDPLDPWFEDEIEEEVEDEVKDEVKQEVRQERRTPRRPPMA